MVFNRKRHFKCVRARVIIHPNSRALLERAARTGDTHMKLIAATGLVLATLAALANGAAAAPQCGPHEKITQILGTKFQESRQGLGLASALSVVELFVSARGTWTVTTTDTRGLTCVIGAGEGWQAEPRQVAGLNS
jgi:hypothetical protein